MKRPRVRHGNLKLIAVKPVGSDRQSRRVTPVENVLFPIKIFRWNNQVWHAAICRLDTVARDRPLLSSPKNKTPAAIALVGALVDHGCHSVIPEN